MSDRRLPGLLVIEDNPADVQLLEYTLRNACIDCHITVLVDGQQGLAWARSFDANPDLPTPDLVVADINLPKHDGIEILEAMQRSPVTAAIPVLVLSSSPSPRDKARAAAFPNTRYVTKPSDLEGYLDLAGILREMLAGARHTQL